MSQPRHDVGRWRAAFHAVSDSDTGDGRGCPAPEALWAAAHGELRASRRRRIVDHTAGCAGCAEAWRLARELAPSPAVPARVWWPRGTTGGFRLAAAGLAVAVVGAIWMMRPQEARDRGAEPGGRGAEAIASLINEGRPLSRARCLLRWSPGPPGSTYSIEVASEALELVSSARGLDRPSYTVPEADLRRLPPGAKIVWQVRVHLVDGTSRPSASFVNRVE